VDFIPGMMVEVIRVGESSGNLPEVLNKNADYYENAINLKVNTIISLIEPVLIIFLGLVIAFMLISVYLPIFQTIQVVR
jgi:type IV pilus assembly protein PilC